MSLEEVNKYVCKKCGTLSFSLEPAKSDSVERCPSCGKIFDVDDIYEIGIKLRIKDKDSK